MYSKYSKLNLRPRALAIMEVLVWVHFCAGIQKQPSQTGKLLSEILVNRIGFGGFNSIQYQVSDENQDDSVMFDLTEWVHSFNGFISMPQSTSSSVRDALVIVSNESNLEAELLTNNCVLLMACREPIMNTIGSLRLDLRLYTLCTESEDIFEHYGFEDTSYHKIIGSYQFDTGLKILNPNILDRRQNLEGLGIKTKSLVQSGAQSFLASFYRMVAISLSNSLNFTLNEITMKSQDGSYGNKLDNGTFTGYIGELVQRQYHVLVADLSLTYERSQVIDFSIPVHYQSARIAVPRPGLAQNWHSYLQVFSMPIWIATFSTALVFVFSYKIIFQDHDNDWLESFGTIFCTMLNRELAFVPHGTGQKILTLTILLTCYLLFSLYGALLVSFLTVEKSEWPFTDLESFLKTDIQIVGVLGSHYDELKFTNSQSLLGRLYNEKWKPNHIQSEALTNYLRSNLSAFQNIERRQSLISDKVGHFTDMEVIATLPKYPCEIVSSPLSIMIQPNALGFQKGSDLVPLFNFHLLKLMESGVMEEMQKKYFPSKSAKMKDCGTEDRYGLGFHHTVSIFLLVPIGICMAILTLSIEGAGFRIRLVGI